MIYIGKNITAPNDPLFPTTEEKVFKALTRTDGPVAELVNRLQQIRAIDPNKYRKMKVGLPYMVCATFHPMLRKKENFLHTDSMFVDLDHLSQNGLDKETLKSKLRSDSRIALFFTSPSGDGLKLLFRFSEKISDSGYYALFYKTFCTSFNQEYHLGGALDIVTHDVSRACFVSCDPEAYWNPNATPIEVEQILPKNDFQAFDRASKQVKSMIDGQKEALSAAPAAPKQDFLTDDALRLIKLKVGQRIRSPKPKEYFQPEELTALIPEIEKLLAEIGVQLIKTEPISYGRVLRVGVDSYWAELNIFYGHKRGATVVKTAKTGSNAELLESSYLLIKDFLENK